MKSLCTRAFSVLSAIALIAAALLSAPAHAAAKATFTKTSTGKVTTDCIAHRPNYLENRFEVKYAKGCSGHDEPELDPISNAPGSAKDLTWRFVLPADGRFPVDATGGVFWFGGTVDDPNSLFGQAFLEVQFYADSIVTKCTPNGNFKVTYAPNTYSVCSPVWKITVTGNPPVYHEPAAFNAMLTNGHAGQPLIMHAGDVITVHFYVTDKKDGWHIKVADETTGGSGRIVLVSPDDGPLMPSYNRQQVGKSLKWGVVHDTPNSFVWEIGHTSPYTTPPGKFCLPGETDCFSYDAPAWRQTKPISIMSVRFEHHRRAKHWAVVSDYGGRAEVEQYCGHYGGPFCIYPWFTSNAAGYWHYGVDYPDTTRDYGRVRQFETDTDCGGPFGPNSTYCVTRLR